jgi:uncharacterized membrane protein YfcA
VDSIAVYILAVYFVAALVRSAFGFGDALVGVPLLALRIPITVAVPLTGLLSVAIAGIVVAQDWREVQPRSAAWLVGATLLGIPLGLWLLATADEHVVKALLAAVIVLFSSYSLAGAPLHLQRDRRGVLLGCGFLAGVLGGANGMSGPPIVCYGTLRRWSPRQFRATLQAYFLPAGLIAVTGYAAAGLVSVAVLRDFVMCLPGALVAIVLGRAINRRIAGRAFQRYVHVGLLAIAALLIAQIVTA